MSDRNTRKRIADANAKVRRLLNRVHELEQGSLPLRAEIQGLQQELRHMTAKHATAQRVATACQNAFDAIVSALHETRIASGKEPL